MVIDDNKYLPMTMLLRLAIERKETFIDENISIMVEDAQFLIQKKVTIREVHESIYRYAVAIERRKPELVVGMEPKALGEKEYRALLDFFESL